MKSDTLEAAPDLHPELKLDVSDGVATVTINRPGKRNALTLALWRNLGATVAALGRRADVRVIVITGTGESFCAGADIAEFAEVRSTERQVVEYEAAFDGCCNAIEAAPKPTLAAINGFCMGGGCNVAMACDFRFAVPGAQFAIPAARLSIVYGTAGTRRLLSLVGLAHAKRILYTAERFDAATALRMGFVDEVGDDLWAVVGRFSAVLRDNAPLSISGAKMILNALAAGTGALREHDVEEAVRRAAHSFDYAEGRAAFVEKRRPAFRGE
ncbi:3-hydroxybutyryl-CoA dehydratase [Burkholderia sp. WAC0059]|uniref:enoyl-CoA hydratase-related protein n=1 Tax=Burkholderia sp. WAC0059 TaxID=2066022 RepID=UPI000C7ECF41|nr:enoyl-CoA hydratase-related protein [Burkholderia sp. WAC0059]PLZ00155.1 3-hydroxybutyryl-CoA dehydratase [Burkholderia sp. WAC0059]